MDDPAVAALRSGSLYAFADWPNPAVPRRGAGVYSVWDGDRLVYVGMSGRSMTAETPVGPKPLGIWTRLNSHASGRRSGDQFCVYVSDRLVLPELDRGQIERVAGGTLPLDELVRAYIRARLAYRFVVVPDGAAAFALEHEARAGALGQLPFLNPVPGGARRSAP